MPPPRRSLPWPAIALAVALPAVAQPATLTVSDPLISIAECEDRSNQSVELSWDLGTSTGSSVEILGSDEAGCSESDATTAVLVDGLSTSQTYYPSAGDATLTLTDVLSAAGKTPDTCEGTDFRVYVCVRLLDSSASEVTTASAVIKLQRERPPAPVGLAVGVGEGALYVSFSEGTATSAAPASSVTYQAFASAGGATYSSAESTSTSDVRVGGLENGTTYDVWVVAYSESGNASDRSERAAGTPQPVKDFYDVYEASGGAEGGGCDQGGGAGPLAAIVALWALRRPLSRRAPATAGLLAVLVAAAPARAGDGEAPSLTSANEISARVLQYRPAIDSEFTNGAAPYALMFGSRAMWGGRLDWARTVSSAAGTVGLGLGVGYLGVRGHGLYVDPATGAWATSRDATAVHVFPASAFALARLDALAIRWGVPLAPYARAALERYTWIATGTGHSSTTGATNGWSCSLGLALLLDRVDPTLSHELARETGVRHTSLVVEATRASVDDFGSAQSWDLSTRGWSLSGGFTFAF